MNWLDDLVDCLVHVMLPVGLIVSVVLVGVFGIGELWGRYTCRQYESITGFATQWSAFDNCYVQRDGRFWRWDEYTLAYATTAGAAP